MANAKNVIVNKTKSMDFNYHPILGLQFTCGLSIYEIDLDSIPQNYDWKDVMELLHVKGINFVSSIIKEPIIIFSSITSNSTL